jgi:hypothetical protein
MKKLFTEIRRHPLAIYNISTDKFHRKTIK